FPFVSQSRAPASAAVSDGERARIADLCAEFLLESRAWFRQLSAHGGECGHYRFCATSGGVRGVPGFAIRCVRTGILRDVAADRAAASSRAQGPARTAARRLRAADTRHDGRGESALARSPELVRAYLCIRDHPGGRVP